MSDRERYYHRERSVERERKYQRERYGQNSYSLPTNINPDLDDITRGGRKLIVLGLSWSTNDDSLRQYFEEYGSLDYCRVMRDRENGRSRGFGFVTFDYRQSAERVLNTKDHSIDGRRVDPKYPLPRNTPVNDSPTAKKLFVAKLDPSLSEKDLKKYFERFGRVTDVYIPRDANGRDTRRFGFVTFTSGDVVERVRKLDHEISGFSIRVDRAEPKREDTNHRYSSRHSPASKYQSFRKTESSVYISSPSYSEQPPPTYISNPSTDAPPPPPPSHLYSSQPPQHHVRHSTSSIALQSGQPAPTNFIDVPSNKPEAQPPIAPPPAYDPAHPQPQPQPQPRPQPQVHPQPSQPVLEQPSAPQQIHTSVPSVPQHIPLDHSKQSTQYLPYELYPEDIRTYQRYDDLPPQPRSEFQPMYQTQQSSETYSPQSVSHPGYPTPPQHVYRKHSPVPTTNSNVRELYPTSFSPSTITNTTHTTNDRYPNAPTTPQTHVASYPAETNYDTTPLYPPNHNTPDNRDFLGPMENPYKTKQHRRGRYNPYPAYKRY